MKITKAGIINIAKDVLRNEANSILRLERNLDRHAFITAVNLLHKTKSKIVVSGLGKSGIVARKIAATLSSVSIFSLFVHPVEALHGDIGMIAPGDVILVISHSGEAPEIIAFVEAVKLRGNELIAVTAHKNSFLAKNANVTISTRVREEACKICKTFNLVPTTSSIVSLAVGDALVAALQELKEIPAERFAYMHPGGVLGKISYNGKHGQS